MSLQVSASLCEPISYDREACATHKPLYNCHPFKIKVSHGVNKIQLLARCKISSVNINGRTGSFIVYYCCCYGFKCTRRAETVVAVHLMNKIIQHCSLLCACFIEGNMLEMRIRKFFIYIMCKNKLPVKKVHSPNSLGFIICAE